VTTKEPVRLRGFGVSATLACLLVAAIGASTFELGGVKAGAAPLLVAAVALLGAVWAGLGVRRPVALEPRLRVALALASVPLLVGALELVPLPHGAVETLAPATAELHAKDDAASAREPTSRPLSIEPGTSRRDLERGVALVALFVLVVSIARRTEDARVLVLSLLALGALVAVTALSLSDGAKWAGRARTPFGNPNHLATFLGVILPLALGVVLGRSHKAPAAPPTLDELLQRPDLVAKVLALVAVAVLAAAVVQSQSRAGVAATALGVAVALGASRALSSRRFALATLVVVALAIGVSNVNVRAVSERYAAEKIGTRAEYWRLGGRILEGRELTGSGLGTYDAASFALLTSESSTVLFVRPERAHNDYLNLATDLGIPAALAGIAAIVLLVVTVFARLRTATGDRRALAAGALGGAVCALAHAFFDFGLELAPVGAVLAVALGVAWSCSAPEDREERTGSRALRVVATLGLLVLALRGARDVRGEIAAEQATDLTQVRAARALAADDAELAEREARLARRQDAMAAIEPARDAVRLAPGDSRAQAELALALLDAANDHETLRAEGERRLALALELGPSWDALHFDAFCYWLDRTARTNDRAFAARASHELQEAIRLQLEDHPRWKETGRRYIEVLVREQGKLGVLADELLASIDQPR
jgi:O-antigen ligase